MVYSTGKDYEDFIGQFPLSMYIKGNDSDRHKKVENLEVKGLCPFCNPNSIYYIDKKK